MGRLRCAIGATVVAWLAFGPVAAAAEFPTGTFTASKQKDWSIKFEPKGKFAVVRGGMTVVEGSYTALDTELTLTDEKGPFAAKEDASKTGKYKWKRDGGKLTFTLVEDKSKGRELLLTMNDWVESK
jgi:hypothetical protein